MIRISSLGLLSLLAGCDWQGAPLPMVESSPTCIPDQYAVHAPPWVRESDGILDEGVAFHGCSGEAGPGECALPLEISGGAVSWQNIPARVLKDMPAGAHYAELAVQHRAAATVDPRSGLTVLREPGSKDRWLLWKSPSGVLSPEAELIAVCTEREASIAAGGGRQAKCRRVLEGEGFYVTYTFVAKQRAPHDYDRLDRQLLSVLKGWRCARNATPGN